MDFAGAVEWIKFNLGIENRDICEALNIGEVTLENLLNGYVKPQPFVLQELFSHFSVLPEGEPPIVSEGVPGELPLSRLESRIRAPRRFAVAVEDDALAERRIFAGNCAVIQNAAPLTDGSVVLASVRGGDARLYIYGAGPSEITLTAGGERFAFSPAEFESSVKVAGKVVCVLEGVPDDTY